MMYKGLILTRRPYSFNKLRRSITIRYTFYGTGGIALTHHFKTDHGC